ncbi:hypothetical protein MASR2M47_21110 [Draconibacterium sp.]
MRKKFRWRLSVPVSSYVDRLPRYGEVFAFINEGRDKAEIIALAGAAVLLFITSA